MKASVSSYLTSRPNRDLITWNFKHIANATMRANIDSICRQAGYEPPVICYPYELMEV